MPRYDVFLEGRTESSTCYFGVAVMADDQKEAEYLGHEAGRKKHRECDEIEVVSVRLRQAGKRRLCKYKECQRKYDNPLNRKPQEAYSNIEEEIADVFIMLVQLLAFFRGRESVSITKIVWDKLDRLKDNLDKETAKQEGGKDESPEH